MPWSAPDAEGWQAQHHKGWTGEPGWSEYRIQKAGTAVGWGVRRYARISVLSDGKIYGTSVHGYTRKFTTVEEAKAYLSPRTPS